jgi:MFS transporter, ACS family, glucarate transporter
VRARAPRMSVAEESPVARALSRDQTRSPVRYRVVAFMMALAGVTYLDRVCIATLRPQIQTDLHLNDFQMGYVFSAFTFAYAIFEMPTAWWADRIGSRKVLTRIVVWWSGFTMLTAGAFSYPMMLITRFLFGIGEAGAWPNAGRVFSRWIPLQERGRVQGIFFAGAFFIGGMTPLVVTWLAGYLPWRSIFILFGFVGLAWATAFYLWFRDEPREHPAVTTAERDFIESTRGVAAVHHESAGALRRVLATPRLLALCVQYFANSYGYYFFITWLPQYLTNARGMQKTELALFSGLPLTLSVVAALCGGVLTDALARRLGVRAGYRVVGATAYLLASIIMLTGTLVAGPRLAGILIAVAGACSMFSLAPAWGTAIRLGGQNAGLMGAVMNTSGQIGGILSPLIVVRLVAWYSDWTLPLHVLSGLYLLAAVCWLFVKPERAEA